MYPILYCLACATDLGRQSKKNQVQVADSQRSEESLNDVKHLANPVHGWWPCAPCGASWSQSLHLLPRPCCSSNQSALTQRSAQCRGATRALFFAWCEDSRDRAFVKRKEICRSLLTTASSVHYGRSLQTTSRQRGSTRDVRCLLHLVTLLDATRSIGINYPFARENPLDGPSRRHFIRA